jgi:hypothetical protein
MTQASYIYSSSEFSRLLGNPILLEELATVAGVNYLLVKLDEDDEQTIDPLALPACPVIGIGANPRSSLVDVVVPHERNLLEVINPIESQPTASATLVQLLRHNESVDTEKGLFAESLAYSMLQQSAGFQQWLASVRKPAPFEDLQVLHVERQDNELHLTFNRPKVHNAFNIALRDGLCEALHLAHTDRTITRVVLRGNGSSFCAGGDLSEFGQVTDATVAHLSRMTRSAGALIDSLPCAMAVHVHGACIGAGIELPSFAARVTAREDAFFQLPEVAMGLVPGAGGTVSILRRIGRHRTAFMALTNKRITAELAFEWGLVDRLLA